LHLVRAPAKLEGMALVARFRDDFVSPPPPRDAASDEAFWVQVRLSEHPAQFDALYPSAERLVSEQQARTAALDRQAINVLWWNAGIPTMLLLLERPAVHQPPVFAGVVIGVTMAGLGVACALLALRVPRYRIPTQAEAMAVDRGGDEVSLQRRHLLSIEQWYERANQGNRTQAAWVTRAQRCAWGAASAVAAAAALHHLL
jgi:hypothetical protein